MSGKLEPTVFAENHVSFTTTPPKVLVNEQKSNMVTTLPEKHSESAANHVPQATLRNEPLQTKKEIPSNNATVCASEIPITKKNFQNNEDDDHYSGGLFHDDNRGSLLARLQLNLLLSQQTVQCNQSSNNHQQQQMTC